MSFAGSIDLGYEGLYTVLRSIAFSLMQHGARALSGSQRSWRNNPSIDRMALEVYHAGGRLPPASTGGAWWASWTPRSRAATAIFWKPRP